MKKKVKQFLPGHIVRHTGDFLRSTGQYAGAPINGRVEYLESGRWSEGWPYVLWSDADKPRLVNPANIELDPRAKQINAQVSAVRAMGVFAGPEGCFCDFNGPAVEPGIAFELVFLPYIEYPRGHRRGREYEVYATRQEAEKRMRSLVASDLIEEITLLVHDNQPVRPVLAWNEKEGWIE